MEWLQSLDAGIFRFVNQTIANPFFDRVMPWLSGNVLFIPLAIAVACWLVWRFRVRAAICIAMLALVLPLGDGFVCKTLKQSIRRPRPYMTVTVATQRVKPTSPYSSMPSSHAANWFCATMIAWIFFRRSARVMLPAAIAVSLSRVYNGVHYPGDILTGAILGAGYGFVGVFVVERAWRWAGKKLFPIAHTRLPSLVNAGRELRPAAEIQSEIRNQQSAIETQWLRAGYLLLIVLTLVRWIYIGSGVIQLSEDEAYQWHWSKHLALSYFSKPPFIAYAQFIGTTIWGDNELGVRFLSPLIAAILGFMLLRFFAREVNARVGFALLLMFTATPLLAVGATLMTVDPLSVLFWTAAMLAGWRAIKPDAGLREWFWVGLWMGFGFLSKYTALFQLLCWAVFFALWKPARVHLRKPGPWLAVLVMAVCTIPVIVWNSQHNWITASHVAGNANLNREWRWETDHLEDFGEFVGAEAFLLNPVFFIGTIWACIAFWRKYRGDARLIYFFSMGAPVFLVYLAWTFHSAVFPNWIAPSILPLFCLMILYWERERQAGVKFFQPWFVVGIVFGVAVIILLHDTGIIGRLAGKPLPQNIDPGARVNGWEQVAKIVSDAREKLALEGKPVFVIGAHYGITSLVSFYIPESRERVKTDPFVFYPTSERPQNQFYFWPGYKQNATQDRTGQNAIFVARRPAPPPEVLTNEFASITPLPPVEILYRGQVRHTVYLYECRNLR